MGIAIRTGSPLSLNVAEPIWKLLAGSQLIPDDIAEVSKAALDCTRVRRFTNSLNPSQNTEEKNILPMFYLHKQTYGMTGIVNEKAAICRQTLGFL